MGTSKNPDFIPEKGINPNCCVAGKISCLHIKHMRRCDISPAPCIWANSEFLKVPYAIHR